MTPETPRTIRAIGLCSGGLDSMLSALVLRSQGIHVEWINFETPFFSSAKARKAARIIEIPLHVQDITPDYLTMLKAPRAGLGRNMNPCMDCHALMFNKAGQFMQANGYDFLFSGEVLGQRPMSQTAPSLRYVAKHSGYADYILRPLSARRLAETPMEQQGWVDRHRLLDLSGRSRKPQIALAAQFGISEYPAPGGGCHLTDPGYSRRLKDLMDHGDELSRSALNLLQHGRHLRLGPKTKIIVGRTEQDNEQILQLCEPQRDTIIKTKNKPGPTVVMPGGGSSEMVFLAACICAGYSKALETEATPVQITTAGKVDTITVLPILPHEAKRFLL
jgi:tRNA-uridine 2-sulfurtransferase